ncbi:protein-tyrosine phosphatase-like protein [Pyronema domesticum]|uniref:protein-tyrosine-phosphatase n=1 Tax=Pyronema omphalodes (strain CBS 100304) TaxID=1076935 RepID=U4LNJ9_PYROM|nr:protein-tyrosine phosphatase-like protein [Pyronema domesticum]CCX30900.1 Similar to Dual specificity protein phosphatase 22; acc. no. Q5XHB2 [Pyronema omphalodes CBS 100304]
MAESLDIRRHVSYDEIIPGLFLGNLIAAKSNVFLQEQGITHVLSLTTERVEIAKECGIVHKQFVVRDNCTQNLLQSLLEGVQFIEDAFTGALKFHSAMTAEPKVFVHCRMGISRSASIVVAYVMKIFGYSYEEGLRFVKGKRRVINPNKAFVAQLNFLHSTNFDLTHLSDILSQSIENPYDPYDPDEERYLRKERKMLKKTKPWKMHPQKWTKIRFATKDDIATYKDCMKECHPPQVQPPPAAATSTAAAAAAAGGVVSPPIVDATNVNATAPREDDNSDEGDAPLPEPFTFDPSGDTIME